MKTIWKFPLTKGVIEMPLFSQVISFQLQNGIPTLWAIVDESLQRETRKFYITPTGSVVLDGSKYIGTVQDKTGLVWHAFEEVATL